MTVKLPFNEYCWPMKNKSNKPYKHQIQATKFKLENKRCYDLSDLGTGKTLSSLWAADFLICNDKIKRVLVVGPLSTLQSVWGREIFTNLPHRKYAIAHGNRDLRVKIIRGTADFVIINHDGVVIMEEVIIAAGFDAIIVDELTAFKNHRSNRTKAMIRIANSVKAVWGLTGAPTPNGPSEAFGQAKVVTPDNPELPKYFKQFQQMVEHQVGPYLWIPNDNSSEVVGKILQPAIRFERDKCLDIPPCQYEDRIVEFTPSQKKLYNEMKKDLLIEFSSGAITAVNAAVKMMKLLQIAAGSVKDDEGIVVNIDSSTRDNELWEIFEQTGKTKMVVFSAFTGAIEHLMEFFQSKKVRVACIQGSVNHKARAAYIQDFQEGDLQILVIQPQSSAHGITLTAANVIVWHSLIASGEIYTQANGRITRAGQLRKQHIIHLIGCHAEKRLLEILRSKGDLSREVLRLFVDL